VVSESVNIKFARPDDLAALGAFLPELGGTYVYERYPGKTARDFYRWKYFDNPLGEAIVGIAVAEGRVVSCVAAVAKPLQINGQPLLAYELGDFLTAPDFRKRGFFSKLTEMVCGEAAARGASLTYVRPNDNSFPLLKKLGFTEPQQIRQRHYPRPSILLSRRLHLPAKFVSWTHIDDWARRLVAPPPGARGLHVERLSRFNADTDEVWNKSSQEYKFVLARESQFLNWRYVDSPTPFHIWLARRNGEPVGFLVGFTGKDQGVALIADLFTAPRDTAAGQALLHVAFEEYQRQNLTTILAWTLARPPYSTPDQLLRRACPVSRGAALHFAVRSFGKSGAVQLPASGWHLSLGDFDGV
jgi:GNAT superfamily N-acetyltransferase